MGLRSLLAVHGNACPIGALSEAFPGFQERHQVWRKMNSTKQSVVTPPDEDSRTAAGGSAAPVTHPSKRTLLVRRPAVSLLGLRIRLQDTRLREGRREEETATNITISHRCLLPRKRRPSRTTSKADGRATTSAWDGFALLCFRRQAKRTTALTFGCGTSLRSVWDVRFGFCARSGPEPRNMRRPHIPPAVCAIVIPTRPGLRRPGSGSTDVHLVLATMVG